MTAQLALQIVTWAAIIVLYLGLAAVLREVRLLRDRLGSEAAAGASSPVRLPGSVTDGRRRIVAAVDSGCPLCLVVVQQLDARSASSAVRPVLLTYEPVERWSDVSDDVDVVRDERAWSAVAHLSPPVLMLVDGTGLVEHLVLPANERDVQRALQSWEVQLVTEKKEQTHVA